MTTAVDIPRRPTPAEMQVWLAAMLMLRGYVLACDSDDDVSYEEVETAISTTTHHDGVVFGPKWTAIPADVWHERYAVA